MSRLEMYTETLLQLLSDETRVVVSEPLGERPGHEELATLIARTS